MYNILARLFKILSNFHVTKGNKSIYNIEDKFTSLSNDELKQKCKSYYNADNIRLLEKERQSIKGYIISRFDKIFRIFLLRSSIDKLTIEQIALATEVFKRIPADLPTGSALFPQQVSAAVSLTQRCLVQMNTGEGKTYAILPAAFSLLCQYRQVYIICANDYLALRDAQRTQNFWNFMGFEVGLCQEADPQNHDWKCPVVYTTLQALLFLHLRNEVLREVPPHPVNFGALILDEADAILLDTSDTPYQIIHSIRSESYDWSFPLTFAKELQADIHITEYYESLFSNLTIEGENLLKSRLKDTFGSTDNYLRYREAVENAYTGIYMAKEGVHYIIKDSKVQVIDLLSGKIEADVTRSWVYPLEFLKGLQSRIDSIPLHSLTIRNFIQLFNHISGTSGSIIDDATDYFFSYLLFTIVIPPRRPRYKKGQKLDSIYKTKNEAKHGLVNAAIEELKKGRSLLIGTQNINDAEELFYMLSNNQKINDTITVRLVTGKNQERIASIMETAGETGMVTVATQLAGRGVDIRLSNELRDRGGLALLCLEHSLTMRHDKQFLGRVGRQGDPFTSEFFVSYEDELFQQLGGRGMGKFLKKMGIKEGESMKNSMVSNGVLRAQKQNRNNKFLSRITSSLVDRAYKEVYDSFSIWINQFKSVDDPKNFKLSTEFKKWLIDKYVSENIHMLLPAKKDLTYEQATIIKIQLKEDLDINIDTHIIEGRDKAKVISIITEALQAHLHKILNDNDQILTDINGDMSQLWQDFENQKRVLNNLKLIANDISQLIVTGNGDLLPVEEKKEPLADEVAVISNLGAGNIDYLLKIDSQLQNLYQGDLKELIDKHTSSSCLVDDWRRLGSINDNLIQEVETIANNTADTGNNLVIEYNYRLDRKPEKIVFWSIFKPWAECLKENRRDEQRLKHSSHNNGIDYSRKVCDEVLKNWERTEIRLAPGIIKNLLNVNSPTSLNELFNYEDNAADDPYYKDDVDKTYGEIWKANKKRLEGTQKQLDGSQVNNFINQFIQGPAKALKLKDYTYNDLQQTLIRFSRLCPVTTLRTPAKIQEAILTWEKEEIASSVVRKRRKINKTWVLSFLNYLSELKIIGRMPTLGTLLKSNIQRLGKNLSDTKTILAIVNPIAFLAIFITLSVIGKWMQPKTLDGWQLYLDYILFGGFITTGAITASCFAVTLGMRIYNNGYLNLLIGFIIQAAILWWQLNWDTRDSYALLTNILLSLVTLYFSYKTMMTEKATRASTDISFVAGWISYCILCVFIPSVFGWQSKEMIALLAVAILYYYWRLKINYTELIVLSSLTNSSAIQNSEYIRSSMKIEGSIGFTEHMYASIASLSLYLLFSFKGLQFSVDNVDAFKLACCIAVYIITLFLVMRATLKTRLSPKLWQKTMNSRHVVLIDGNKKDSIDELDISKELNKHFSYVFTREFLFQLAILAVLIPLFITLLPGLPIPGFILMPAILILFAENIYSLTRQLYRLLISRSPASFEQIDLTSSNYSDKDLPFWERFSSIRFVKKVIFWIATTLGFIKFVYELITDFNGVVKIFKDIF
jgi:preprotein translocase subunit SecA